MHFDHLHSNNNFLDRTFEPIILRENQTLRTELNQTNINTNKLNSVSTYLLWITIVSMIILWLVKILHQLEKLNTKGLSILPNAQVPCRSCRFFNQNEYLRCAVNPCAVMTKQATNCSDYCHKYEAYFQADFEL